MKKIVLSLLAVATMHAAESDESMFYRNGLDAFLASNYAHALGQFDKYWQTKPIFKGVLDKYIEQFQSGQIEYRTEDMLRNTFDKMGTTTKHQIIAILIDTVKIYRNGGHGVKENLGRLLRMPMH